MNEKNPFSSKKVKIEGTARKNRSDGALWNNYNSFDDLRSSMSSFLKDSKITNIIEEKNTSFNDDLMKYKEMKMIYEKTGIKPIYFLYVLIALVLLIFIGYLESYLTLLIGTLYPLYISIKTIQSGDQNDVKQWLTYW